nr:MFS transporter [Alicyclobacillus sp. SO9]
MSRSPPFPSLIFRTKGDKDGISKHYRLSRQFLNLWLAQGVSQFGDALLEVTLPVWVGLVTKSSSQVAGVAAAELLPAILVGPLSGVIAERFNPKIIMVLTDLFRAFAVLLLLEFHGAGTAYLAYIVSFLLSFGTRLFIPAQSVLVRKTIRDKDIQKAQGVLHVASSVSLALGPALGGTLILSMGPIPTVITDSGTFILSTLLLLDIRQGTDGLAVCKKLTLPSSETSIKADVMVAFHYLLESRRLVVVAVVTAILTLVGFIWFTVDVFYVGTYLGVPGEAVGYLWAASGLGDLLAGLLIVPRAGKLNSAYLVIGGLLVRTMALFSYSVIGDFWYALWICLLAGFGDGMASIGLSTMAMQHSSPGVIGRVSSTLDIVGQFSGIGATALIAAIGSSSTPRQDLQACGVLLSATIVFVLSWTRPTSGHERTHDDDV